MASYDYICLNILHILLITRKVLTGAIWAQPVMVCLKRRGLGQACLRLVKNSFRTLSSGGSTSKEVFKGTFCPHGLVSPKLGGSMSNEGNEGTFCPHGLKFRDSTSKEGNEGTFCPHGLILANLGVHVRRNFLPTWTCLACARTSRAQLVSNFCPDFIQTSRI